MYYEQNCCYFVEQYTKIFLSTLSRRGNNPHFHERIENEFNYLLDFFDPSVESFIQEINYVNNQFIFKFLNNFSLEERKVICYFLEVYAVLTGKEKYNEYKKQLEVYTEDLNYAERLKVISTQLDMIINNEAPKYTFITTAENIKETAFEINYLVESICQLDENTQSTEPYLIYLYETFSKELREITVKSLKCIKEQNNNKKIELYIDELSRKIDEAQKPNIFVSVREAFEKIDKTLIPNHDNSDKKPKYLKLKETLESLCEDLFKFVEDCKIGRFNLRKIKAITKEKVEIIKLVMNCDYLIEPNKKLKDASHTLSLIKRE